MSQVHLSNLDASLHIFIQLYLVCLEDEEEEVDSADEQSEDEKAEVNGDSPTEDNEEKETAQAKAAPELPKTQELITKKRPTVSKYVKEDAKKAKVEDVSEQNKGKLIKLICISYLCT